MKDKITMKNKPRPNDIQTKNYDYTFTPTITTIAVPLLFGRRKEAQPAQEKTPKAKPKHKGVAVDKFELVDNMVRFFAAKGFPKKRWVVLKEIPVGEITSVESFGNDLSVTWQGDVFSFVLRKKSESFGSLRDQIQVLMADQTKTVEKTEKASQTKSDLTAALNASIGVVDASFDILMGLHEKRVNWARLEGYADSLGTSLNFNGQTIAPLTVDFADLSAAIKRQVPKETSKEAYAILKLIYGYFDALKPVDDEKVDFENAKAAIYAYYTLNDLLFAKVIGEKDSERESLALEGFLLGLANGSKVKVSFVVLKAGLDRFGGLVEGGSVGDVRGIFRDQLKLL